MKIIKLRVYYSESVHLQKSSLNKNFVFPNAIALTISTIKPSLGGVPLTVDNSLSESFKSIKF